MPWTRLDDGFKTNPKILRLSDAAFRLYVMSLNWSVAELQDGKVPNYLLDQSLPRHQRKAKVAAVVELEQAELWHQNGSGWVINDFDKYQESAEKVKRRRQDTAERQRKHRVTDVVTRDKPRDNAVTNASVTPLTGDARPGVPIPIPPAVDKNTHPPFTEDPERVPMTRAERAIEAWCRVVDVPFTRKYVSKAITEAGQFLRVHPELDDAGLQRFFDFAAKTDCAHPHGWETWYVKYRRKNPPPVQELVLPDCQRCKNHRFVIFHPDGSEETADGELPEGIGLSFCPDCHPSAIGK